MIEEGKTFKDCSKENKKGMEYYGALWHGDGESSPFSLCVMCVFSFGFYDVGTDFVPCMF